MTEYLLDTCAISEFARREPNPGFLAWAHEVDPARTHISAITIGELRYGIGQSNETQRARLEAWLSHEVLPELGSRVVAFDANIAERWVVLCAVAQRAGATLSALDAAIAATATRLDLTLVTRNERNFLHTGVLTLNPWS